jgi:HPt (histidine-containing phosphotransfer) domain-containing protein
MITLSSRIDGPKQPAPGTSPEDAAKEQAAISGVAELEALAGRLEELLAEKTAEKEDLEREVEELKAQVQAKGAENAELRELVGRALAAADAAQGQ